MFRLHSQFLCVVCKYFNFRQVWNDWLNKIRFDLYKYNWIFDGKASDSFFVQQLKVDWTVIYKLFLSHTPKNQLNSITWRKLKGEIDYYLRNLSFASPSLFPFSPATRKEMLQKKS